MATPEIVCEHPGCRRDLGDTGVYPFAGAPAFAAAVATAAHKTDNALVAGVPLAARASAAAYAQWLAQLRQLVADSSASREGAATAAAAAAAASAPLVAENSDSNGGAATTAAAAAAAASGPLDWDMAGIVCEYLDALGDGAAPVWVVAPNPFCAVAALPARLTLGQALAVLVNAIHDRRTPRCRHATADVVRALLLLRLVLADATLEAVEGWELALDTAAPWEEDEAKLPPQEGRALAPDLVALAQRPLGLFAQQPVRLLFDCRDHWNPDKYLVRDVFAVAACTLAGVSLHECPPRVARSRDEVSLDVVGVLPPDAPHTSPPTLAGRAAVRAASGPSPVPAVATSLRLTGLMEYAARVAAFPPSCPLTGAPLSQSAAEALVQGTQALSREYAGRATAASPPRCPLTGELLSESAAKELFAR